MGKLTFRNEPENPIPLLFWDELHRTATKDWPSVVKKYKLSPDQIERAAARLKGEKESQASWAAMSIRNFKKATEYL